MSVGWRRGEGGGGGGGGGGDDDGKKTISDCLWVKADSSRRGGLQRLAGGTLSKSQPLLYP